MPRYNYKCYNGCTHPEHPDYSLIWEERHGMFEETEIKCPLCGEEAKKTFEGVEVSFYIRGNGYLDKDGCQRDMNLYKMEKDDPYAHMRQPGEAEDVKDRLRKAGKFDSKPIYFT